MSMIILYCSTLHLQLPIFGDFYLDRTSNLFLVDPVVLGLLVGDELLWLEPKSDLLLGALDGVRAVADVAADVL